MSHPFHAPRLSMAAAFACFWAAALCSTAEPTAAQKVQPSCQLGCITYSTLVDPHGGAVTQPPNSGPYTATFTVYNTSSPAGTVDTYTFSCSVTGGVACVSVSPESATLSSGRPNGPMLQSQPSKGGAQAAFHLGAAGAAYPTSVDVHVTYTVGSSGGTLYLAANGGFSSDQGWYTVTVAAPAPPTVALRNQNGDNVDRSLCLTSSAGDAAGWECGDLVVTHGLPGYATLGRERSLTLLYNSAQAVPRPIVAASVNEGAVSQPTSVFVRLSINGIARDSATYSGWGSAPTTRQVVLAHDATSDATGVYPFTLLVRNQYSGANYDATLSGNLIVVNRSQSEFGAGWSLVGVEQLYFNQPVGASNGSILWVDGDGSAKLYAPAGTNTWVAPLGAYRDTLTYDPASAIYTRTLRHRIQVKFDANGRHIQTVNRVGQQSVFTWTGSPARLTSIQVPPGVSGTTYTLTYDGNGKLDKITDPANRVLDATVVSGLLTSLLDPDGYSTGFAYDGAARMTGRTTRRGYTTSFFYAKALRVDSVKVPLDPTRADTAKTTFQPWDESGLAAGNGSTGNVAVDTAAAYTTIDGPRTDVADIANFWVDRWGAPVKVRDPLGNQTSVTRGDGNNPALVTRAQFADGRILGATYNVRGNLSSVTDSTYQGTGTTQAVTTSYLYGDANVPDSPTSIQRAVDTTLVTYDPSLGLPTLFTAQGGHRTAFQYFTSGATRGLPSSVTDSFVSVVDTTLWTKSAQHLVTQFAYDAWGNDSVIISPKNSKTEIVRDGYRRPQYVRDPMRHRTDYGYDLLNRIDTVTAYDDTLLNGPKRTRYFFSLAGAVDSVLDPRSVKRSWVYDAADRPTTMTDDLAKIETRYYNRSGLMDSLKTRLGHVIRHTYDAAGRLIQTTYPANTYVQGTSVAGDTIVQTYDAVGRLLTAQSRNGVDTLQYNLEGTVRVERQIARDDNKTAVLDLTTRYWYDVGGRRVTFFNGTTDTLYYSYGADARLSKVNVAWKVGSFQPDSFLFTWDGLGRRDGLVYGTIRDTVSFGYDKDGALRMVCSQHPGGATGSFDVLERRVRYTALDADGLVREMVHYAGVAEGSGCGAGGTPLVESMSNTAYDGRHQLLSTSGVPANQLYHYDASGNMTYKTVGVSTDSFPIVAGSNRAQADLLNQSPNPWYPTTYAYDSTGHRTADSPQSGDGATKRFFDALGQLFGDSVTVQGSGFIGNPGMFRYDALGRRVKARMSQATTLNLAYDGANALRGTGLFDWHYAHGPGVDDPLVAVFQYSGCTASWCRVYYLTDGRGRLLAFTDSAGNDQMIDAGVPSLAQLYSAKGGSLAGAIDKSNTFANSRAEAVEGPRLSFYRNRYYDQQSGRFVSEDPIGIAGGVNLYQYAGNNPAAYTDPFGLKPDTIKIQWHEVAGGKFHASIRITPDDQKRWANDPRFKGGSVTLGAGPKGCLGQGVCLVSDLNRKSDVASQAGSQVVDIGGRDENQVIEQLLRADAKYGDNLQYNPLPSPTGQGYNSNSYSAGILLQAGIRPPQLPVAVPGWDKPIQLPFP